MKKAPFFLINMILAVFVLFLLIDSAYGLDAVASIKKVMGNIVVERGKSVISARNGLILYDKDVIVTQKSSKVTIMFRDGSTVRLFPNTRFLIEKSVEAKDGSRRFINKLFLKIGSFWGKFTQRRTETVIKTPTATCGIKGTTVSFLEKDGTLSVGLTSGKVAIQNESESVDLMPGQFINKMTKSGSINEKIQNLPYRLTITPDHNKIELPRQGHETEVYFTLQLINAQTRENAAISGDVYISHEIDKIDFTPNIKLNSRGYARIRATIKPFQPADYGNGQLEIYAIMDGEEFVDVEGGKTVLSYDMPKGRTKTIRIDANSGSIQ